jgi:hypothetical protein
MELQLQLEGESSVAPVPAWKWGKRAWGPAPWGFWGVD